MAVELPELYFRVKDNGALVFRVDPVNRQKRIDLDQIAVINSRNGEVKTTGNADISASEQQAMLNWLAKRQELTNQREMDDIHRTIDQINMTAHWAQAKATPQQLDEVTDRLLLSIFDLRQVLVRKKADRINTQ